MKTNLSTVIIVVKTNRTANNAYSKIKRLKQKIHSAVDDENNFFSFFHSD